MTRRGSYQSGWSSPARISVRSEATVQSCHSGRLSFSFAPVPTEAEQAYVAQHVELMAKIAALEAQKDAFSKLEEERRTELGAQKIAFANEKATCQDQLEAYEVEIEAKQAKLAEREAAFLKRWALLSFKTAAVEKADRAQAKREAETQRLVVLKDRLDALVADAFLKKCGPTDLDAAHTKRVAAKKVAKAKRVKSMRLAQRKRCLSKRKAHRNGVVRMNKMLSGSQRFPSPKFMKQAASRLQNGSPKSPSPVARPDAKKVKSLDKQLSVLQSEKKKLLQRLETLEAEEVTPPKAVTKRLGKQIMTLSQRCRKLQAKRFQLGIQPRA